MQCSGPAPGHSLHALRKLCIGQTSSSSLLLVHGHLLYCCALWLLLRLQAGFVSVKQFHLDWLLSDGPTAWCPPLMSHQAHTLCKRTFTVSAVLHYIVTDDRAIDL